MWGSHTGRVQIMERKVISPLTFPMGRILSNCRKHHLERAQACQSLPVTRSCKTNQRVVCQQEAPVNKNICLLSKEKICLFTATKDRKQILSSDAELCQLAGSQGEALAWRKLWWVLSYWESGEHWCWRKGTWLREGWLLCCLLELHRAWAAPLCWANDAVLLPTSCSKAKAACALSPRFFPVDKIRQKSRQFTHIPQDS